MKWILCWFHLFVVSSDYSVWLQGTNSIFSSLLSRQEKLHSISMLECTKMCYVQYGDFLCVSVNILSMWHSQIKLQIFQEQSDVSEKFVFYNDSKYQCFEWTCCLHKGEYDMMRHVHQELMLQKLCLASIPSNDMTRNGTQPGNNYTATCRVWMMMHPMICDVMLLPIIPQPPSSTLAHPYSDWLVMSLLYTMFFNTPSQNMPLPGVLAWLPVRSGRLVYFILFPLCHVSYRYICFIIYLSYRHEAWAIHSSGCNRGRLLYCLFSYSNQSVISVVNWF